VNENAKTPRLSRKDPLRASVKRAKAKEKIFIGEQLTNYCNCSFIG